MGPRPARRRFLWPARRTSRGTARERRRACPWRPIMVLDGTRSQSSAKRRTRASPGWSHRMRPWPAHPTPPRPARRNRRSGERACPWPGSTSRPRRERPTSTLPGRGCRACARPAPASRSGRRLRVRRAPTAREPQARLMLLSRRPGVDPRQAPPRPPTHRTRQCRPGTHRSRQLGSPSPRCPRTHGPTPAAFPTQPCPPGIKEPTPAGRRTPPCPRTHGPTRATLRVLDYRPGTRRNRQASR